MNLENATFRARLADFERLSTDVGYWKVMSNMVDEDGNCDVEATAKFEELRNLQTDKFNELILLFEKKGEDKSEIRQANINYIETASFF